MSTPQSTENGALTEWGVKHSQGIRKESNERSARESLAWMTEAFEKNFRNKVRPVIVTRTVTPWIEHPTSPASGADS